MGVIRAELEKARRDLLDLGLRNTLLNYRKLRSKGLEIVDERPDAVFGILVEDERPMSFLPVPDRLVDEVEDEEDDLLSLLVAELSDEEDEEDESDGPASRHTDNKLQTSHSKARLERRLLNTFYAARTSIEEQGVNTLYLALGMLHWFEDSSSDIRRSAPLLLVPVELYRTDVRARFRVKFTGEEVGANLSLQAKLKQDFGIELPDLPAENGWTPGDYFAQVEHAISNQQRWHVDDAGIALGFFSFSKFLMFEDLDPENWPEDSQPSDHEVIAALLEDGFHDTTPTIGEDEKLDEHLDPAEIYQIRDADSSQTLAILDAHEGKNLVIQGPPGTGKSQTISNLIAEAIARGRKVLFVAEKMAALEVVKRRLDEDGIGDACLELHSNKTNKKSFLEELQRTLGLGAPRNSRDPRVLRELAASRDELNEYCRAVNSPIGDSGVTPFQAFGRLARLERVFAEVDPPNVEHEPLGTWDQDAADERARRVRDLQQIVAKIGPPSSHPFYGSRAGAVLPKDSRNIADRGGEAAEKLSALEEKSTESASTVGLEKPRTTQDVEELVAALKLLTQRPPRGGEAYTSHLWEDRGTEIEALVQDGLEFREIRAAQAETLLPEAWDRDVLEIRAALRDYGHKWWRLLVPAYRRAVRELRSLCVTEIPNTPEGRMELVYAILECRRLEESIDERSAIGKEVFGEDWRGSRSDWARFEEVVAWRITAGEQASGVGLPARFFQVADGKLDSSDLEDRHGDLAASLKAADAALGEALAAADVPRDEPPEWRSDPIPELVDRLRTWRESPRRLQEMVEFNHARDEIERLQLEPWLEIADTWEDAGRHLADHFRYHWLNALVAEAFEEHPSLASFSRDSHDATLQKFRKLDSELLRANRAAVAEAHWENLPTRTAAGRMGILLREFEKKRRHLPIRQLMAEAGPAVQSIKPVFMMSPLSVATYIPAGSIDFDLVIFDEASQIRPVEGFGAILRADQAVVVGDTKQLPPTSFFDKMVEPEDEEDAAVPADMESILGLFAAQGATDRMLSWHYRSRHESLIAVSNQEFYDNKLVTFPSTDRERAQLGVRFHHLPETHYERGKGRRYNRGEAKRIAQDVMRHAREQPGLSLGVAAFSQSQAQQILDQVELLRRQDPSLESFFQAHPEEPFFVKNLETVQGDERDIIFISVGYGKTSEGLLSHNFGPLNKDGGERRLNVLITRARSRCEVYSNFTAGELDLQRSNARGVVALKRYLKFAETGNMDVPQETDREPDSPFEADVADALRDLDYDVRHQIGSGGFYIDLAILDPDQPGRYLVGIECDGATYHRARWARDRDRLRQQVLEGLGWTIHRVWSTDWFRYPERELKRIVESIEAAKARRDHPPLPNPTGPVEEDTGENPGPAGADSVEREEPAPVVEAEPLTGERYEAADMRHIEYELGGLQLHEVSSADLARWVVAVVQAEGPIHEDEVARRITEGAGLSRTGRRIRKAVDRGIRSAVRAADIVRNDKFLAVPDDGERTPRDRSELSPSSRKIEMVALAEIKAALKRVISQSHGIEREEAVREAARILGYARTSAAIVERIEEALNDSMMDETIRLEGSFLIINEGEQGDSATLH